MTYIYPEVDLMVTYELLELVVDEIFHSIFVLDFSRHKDRATCVSALFHISLRISESLDEFSKFSFPEGGRIAHCGINHVDCELFGLILSHQKSLTEKILSY